MGDKARATKFAEFLHGTFPPQHYKRVADVAGGKGELSLELLKLGYQPTVIDPRKTGLSKAQRRQLRRKLSIAELPRIQTCFCHTQAEVYDLIVGMHPDGASYEIATAAAKRTVVIVPCCNIWCGPDKQNTAVASVTNLWIKKGIPFNQDYLAISGPNTVLVAGTR